MGRKRYKDPYAHHGKPASGSAQSQTEQTASTTQAAAFHQPSQSLATRAGGAGHARDLAQERAKHAWETVQAVKKQGDANAGDFGGHAKKLPMRIRAAGLGQALAFVRAKAKPGDNKKTKPGLILLLEHLGDWVLPRLQPETKQPIDDAALLNAILNGDALFLRRATLETMAWLEWVNRFAEAEGLGDDHDTTKD